MFSQSSFSQVIPTISINSGEFVPGQTAEITGSGFLPDHDYTIFIMRPDGWAVKSDGTEGSDQVITNQNGEFTYNYSLPSINGTHEIIIYDDSDSEFYMSETFNNIAPIISSDKKDYSPGDTALISGKGFDPNTNYDIVVIRPDNTISVGDGSLTLGFDSVSTNTNGSFNYQYFADGLEGPYQIKVFTSSDTNHTSLIAKSGFTDPTSSEYAGSGTPTGQWFSPGNAADGDSNTCASITASGSKYIDLKNFGFSIPAGSSIDSIIVKPLYAREGPDTLVTAQLLDETGTPVGDSVTFGRSVGSAVACPSASVVSLSGITNSTWGQVWDASQINDADFGVQFTTTGGKIGSGQSQQDNKPFLALVQIEVTYTEGEGSSDEADLTITKDDLDDPVVAGSQLTYLFNVTNHGPSDAQNVQVADDLPAGLSFINSTGCDNDPNGNPICNLGTIAAGDSTIFIITVEANSTTTFILNTATVSSETEDPNEGNNEDSAQTLILQQVLVTNGASLPGFDRVGNLDGRQFNLIFTHRNDPQLYTQTASNPGQFKEYVLLVGEPGTEINDLEVKLPFPFVTVGSEPIKVYGNATIIGNSLSLSDQIPFGVTGTDTVTPSGALGVELNDYSSEDFGEVVTLVFNGTIPDSGLFAVSIHLDYGLKQTMDYTPNIDKDGVGSEITILNLQDYIFAVMGDLVGSDTIQNNNIFKNDPGFSGMVLDLGDDGFDPVQGATMTFYSSKGNILGTATTDEDGYYFYFYKHTGKEAEFKVTLDYESEHQEQYVWLKANKVAPLDFNLSYDLP